MEDDYISTTYTWEENKLYLETYSNDYLFVNSKTLDNITSSILMGAISLVGLVGAAIYLKKKNKVRA